MNEIVSSAMAFALIVFALSIASGFILALILKMIQPKGTRR